MVSAVATGTLLGVIDKPGKPGSPKVAARLGSSIRLVWAAPEQAAYASIQEAYVTYVIEFREASMLTWQLAVGECRLATHIIDDLPDKAAMYFRVRAVNAYGISEPSEPSELITVAPWPTETSPPSSPDQFWLTDLAIKSDFDARYKAVRALFYGKFVAIDECRHLDSCKSYAVKRIAKSGIFLYDMHFPKRAVIWIFLVHSGPI